MKDEAAATIAPPAFLAEPAPAAVLAALPGARAVGGCVRDAVAGHAVHDLDVAAPLPPEEIARLLRAAGLKVFETGLAHGTVTAVLAGQPVEVTALRRDVATDGRHAEVEWTEDWQEDAARRDFTINAMSLAPDGRLWDYFGGRADLAAGRVRFVGDPATRLREDYLRALRFFRFWARYGRGAPDAAALAAIADAVEGLRTRIAPERIWMELKRLLAAADPVPALALMQATAVLATVLPDVASLDTLRRLVAIGAPVDPMLRLAALLPAEPGVVTGLATRLRLSGEERERLAELCSPPSPATHPTQQAARGPRGGGGSGWGQGDTAHLRRWLAVRTKVRALAELWLAEARDGTDRATLREWAEATEQPVFPLLGRDLLALGAMPGPQLGRLLHELRNWWLDGGCVATREDGLAEASRRLKEAGAADGTATPARPTGT